MHIFESKRIFFMTSFQNWQKTCLNKIEEISREAEKDSQTCLLKVKRKSLKVMIFFNQRLLNIKVYLNCIFSATDVFLAHIFGKWVLTSTLSLCFLFCLKISIHIKCYFLSVKSFTALCPVERPLGNSKYLKSRNLLLEKA